MVEVQKNYFVGCTARARGIIRAVLDDHLICAEDFFGLYRYANLVEARRDAAKRLLEVGYSYPRVGQFMRRNHTTILNYVPAHQETKRSRHAAKTILRHLTPEARQTVLDYAVAEGVKPELVIAQWVNERALYEAQAKARAAA